MTYFRRGAASVYGREFEYPIAGSEDSPFRSHASAGKLESFILCARNVNLFVDSPHECAQLPSDCGDNRLTRFAPGDESSVPRA